MLHVNSKRLRLSDRDLDFPVEAASPEVTDKPRHKQIIKRKGSRLKYSKSRDGHDRVPHFAST